MLKQAMRYYHTLKYLQWTQIKYRLLYQIKKNHSLPTVSQAEYLGKVSTENFHFQESIASPSSWLGDGAFRFLNISNRFDNEIDWNYSEQGKLWTYNLNYFEFLSQPNISKIEGLGLIHDFIGKEDKSKDGMEPFPISLRIIFWIKFLFKFRINDVQIQRSLFRQLRRLSAMPEYHLMGNHLLENGFGLLFGGIYFQDKKILQQARAILKEQLEEQILEDGAHFELSPMYHQIMLFRILDCINLLKNSKPTAGKDLLELLKEKATLMLGWMKEMTFENGDMPLLNDSANGIAPTAAELFQYAQRLELSIEKIDLSDSGYRKFSNSNYEVIVDVGNIGPDYIPGHAHSDTFNFILYHKGKPLIVDTGISTYEKNERRTIERSTASHNTVMVEGKEQSEVWGGFRVARRAKVKILTESNNRIEATHDGYKKLGVWHRRVFEFRENEIDILDDVGNKKFGTAIFHFHPDVDVVIEKGKISGEDWSIEFDDSEEIEKLKSQKYLFATGFNKTREALKVEIPFFMLLKTTIILS